MFLATWRSFQPGISRNTLLYTSLLRSILYFYDVSMACYDGVCLQSMCVLTAFQIGSHSMHPTKWHRRCRFPAGFPQTRSKRGPGECVLSLWLDLPNAICNREKETTHGSSSLAWKQVECVLVVRTMVVLRQWNCSCIAMALPRQYGTTIPLPSPARAASWHSCHDTARILIPYNWCIKSAVI